MGNTGLVWPLDFNLGVAPQAPRGARTLAPRVSAKWQFTLGQVFARVRVNQSPLLLPTWTLQLTQMIPGQAFNSLQGNGLLPNPYSG